MIFTENLTEKERPERPALESRRSQMPHFRQPEVANSAPPTGQSAYRPGRTIHRFLQLWCFGQFSQEILPLPSGKAAADLALIHQPALNPLTQQQRTYGLFASRRNTTDTRVHHICFWHQRDRLLWQTR